MSHNLSLKYKIRPASIENAPLLLLLHGYGSNEDDLFSFAPELDDKICVVSARAPYDMEPYGAAWYAINFDATGGKFSDTNQALASSQLILKFIKELQETYNISEDVHLLGFSQGAILSYGLSLSHPQLFKTVTAMSGYINEDLIEQRDDLVLRFRESVTTPAFFISHGTMDQVVPYAWASKAPALMDSIDADYVFKDYPIGHGVARDNFYDMKTWLEKRIFN